MNAEMTAQPVTQPGVPCSTSRGGDVRVDSAMEGFFSGLKNGRVRRPAHRAAQEAKADLFNCMERFYNP